MSDTWKVIDKYHQNTLDTISLMTNVEAMDMVQAGIEAFEKNRHHSQGKRAKWLLDVAELLQKKKEKFVDLIVKEAGKPKNYAQVEVERSLFTLKTGAEEATRLGGEKVPMNFGNGVGKQVFTDRFPLGLVLGISPFNFPLNLALHKIVPAIATGNAIMIKPSPYTPLVLKALEKIFREANVPKDLFQVVICDNEVSEALVRDERIKMLSFTGSPAIGWMLKEKAGKKKVTLELGGNAAVLIDEGTDIKRTSKLLAGGCFLYAGQICISTQRIYVHSSLKEELQEELLKDIEKIQVGDPQDMKTTVGPLIAKEHLKRVDQWVQESISQGAMLLCGGKILDEKKNLYAPTLLTGTKKGQKVVEEEVFGPVAIIEEVESFREGLNKINDSRFGLQAGIFTKNIDFMKEAFQTLEVGGVIMNHIPGFRVDSMPYGGVKDSGLGREGLKYAMEDMTEPRLLIF